MLASCILPHVECHTVRLLCSYSFFATGIPVVVSHHFGHFTVPVFLVHPHLSCNGSATLLRKYEREEELIEGGGFPCFLSLFSSLVLPSRR